jgi:hypothetical protein
MGSARHAYAFNMINEPGHPTGYLKMIPLKQETIMLKTISAALLAVSVLAAPAMAAGANQTVPAVKTHQAKSVTKVSHLKANVLNANAKMGRHHHKHVRHIRHHRSHKG